MANEGSGASTRVLEGVTLASPPGNERDEVRWDEWGSEEDGEDDKDMHCGDAGVFGELGKTAHADRDFIGMECLGYCQPRYIVRGGRG